MKSSVQEKSASAIASKRTDKTAIARPRAFGRAGSGIESALGNQRFMQSGITIQRKCAGCQSKEPAQMGHCPACEKDNLLQRKTDSKNSTEAAHSVTGNILKAPGAPLQKGTRKMMESRFQRDFQHVRIHTGMQAQQSTKSLNAKAYTFGEHIVFGNGAYQPSTRAGQHLLAHELAHVLQQREGAAVLSRQSINGEINIGAADDPLEREADKAADAVMANSAEDISISPASASIRRLPFDPVFDRRPDDDFLGHHGDTPYERHRRAGGTLSYRDSQNYADCMRIMNDTRYCEEAVLGIRRPPAPQPPPVTCQPSGALSWTDFAGTPAAGHFAALTAFNFTTINAQGRDWIVANFNGASSWVRPRFANPLNRATNGCAGQVRACEQHFNRHTAAGHVGITFSLGRSTGCAASPQPNTALQATQLAQCNSILGTECDRVAALESARLLHHEQVHFDIACVLARKGNRAIASSGSTTQQILRAVRAKAGQQTRLYDRETNHGCNAAAQARWNTDVAAGLPGVSIP